MKHLTGPEMCRVLEQRGWTLARTRGAHSIYNRPGARRPIPVPESIMREAGLTEDDL
jgi:predicted RNA binding protein YcfA (HicA-like mRNA interferase family)